MPPALSPTAAPTARHRLWPAALLGLLLACAQLVLVLHETEHALEPGSDACPICLVASHAGDAPPASIAPGAPLLPRAEPPPSPARGLPFAASVRQNARAPPFPLPSTS